MKNKLTKKQIKRKEIIREAKKVVVKNKSKVIWNQLKWDIYKFSPINRVMTYKKNHLNWYLLTYKIARLQNTVKELKKDNEYLLEKNRELKKKLFELRYKH